MRGTTTIIELLDCLGLVSDNLPLFIHFASLWQSLLTLR